MTERPSHWAHIRRERERAEKRIQALMAEIASDEENDEGEES